MKTKKKMALIATKKVRKRLGDNYSIYKLVKIEIDKWNPYGLLPEAPNDEFDSESEEIALKISYASSAEEITRVVSEVFSRAFDSEGFTVEKCEDVAKNIKTALDRSA